MLITAPAAPRPPSPLYREVNTMNLEYDTPLEAMHAPLQRISLPSSSGA